MQNLIITTRDGQTSALISADLVLGERYAVTVTPASGTYEAGTLVLGLFDTSKNTLAGSVDCTLTDGIWVGTLSLRTAELEAAFTAPRSLSCYLLAYNSTTGNVLVSQSVNVKWAPVVDSSESPDEIAILDRDEVIAIIEELIVDGLPGVPAGIYDATEFLSPALYDATNTESYAPLKHDESTLVRVGAVRSGTKAVISYRNPGALTGDVVLDIITVDKATLTSSTTSTTISITANQLAVDAEVTLDTAVTALAELRVSRDYADAADTLASYLNLLTAGVA